MKHFEVEIQYKRGTIFEEKPLYSNKPISKYMIDQVQIDFDQYNDIHKITYKVLQECPYTKKDEEIRWRFTNTVFTEEYLNYLNIEKSPYKVNIEFKHDVGDILISGVNRIFPNELETWKDSGPFCGEVLEVYKRRVTIDEKDNIFTEISEYYEIVDGGKIRNDDNKKLIQGWPLHENYCSKIDELDWNTIIDWKCQEMSKKMWREDIRPLYTLNGETVMNQYHSEDFMNPWTALFHYLGKEEYAIDLYLKYVEDRLEGRKPGTQPRKKNKSIKKESSKIDNILMELSDKEKEELLKKLMKS